MKRLAFAAAFAALSFSGVPSSLAQRIENPSKWDGAVSQSEAIDLAKLINAYGYNCATITSVRKMIMKRGFTVYCNNFGYKFEVEDRGGKIKVTYK